MKRKKVEEHEIFVDYSGNHVKITPNEIWYVRFGSGNTVHRVQFLRFEGHLAFIKKVGKQGVLPFFKTQVVPIQQ